MQTDRCYGPVHLDCELSKNNRVISQLEKLTDIFLQLVNSQNQGGELVLLSPMIAGARHVNQ